MLDILGLDIFTRSSCQCSCLHLLCLVHNQGQGLVPRLRHCMCSLLYVNTCFEHLMIRHQFKQLVSKLSVEKLFFFYSSQDAIPLHSPRTPECNGIVNLKYTSYKLKEKYLRNGKYKHSNVCCYIQAKIWLLYTHSL